MPKCPVCSIPLKAEDYDRHIKEKHPLLCVEARGYFERFFKRDLSDTNYERIISHFKSCPQCVDDYSEFEKSQRA